MSFKFVKRMAEWMKIKNKRRKEGRKDGRKRDLTK